MTLSNRRNNQDGPESSLDLITNPRQAVNPLQQFN